MSSGQDWAHEQITTAGSVSTDELRRRLVQLNVLLPESKGEEHNRLYLEREAILDRLEGTTGPSS